MSYRSRTLFKISAGLVLVGAMALFAYFGLYSQQRSSRRKEMEAKLALDFVKEHVIRIELVRGNSIAVVEKQGIDKNQLPSWHMLNPVDTNADSVVVNSFLGVLERMDAERRIDISKVGTLNKYGLAKPRLKWILFLKNGKKIELLLGKKSPFDGQLYLMVAGANSVLMVKGYLEDSLIRNTYDLREKRLFLFDSSRIKGLVLQKINNKSEPGRRVELDREDGRWKIIAPLKDKADDKAVEKIINALENLRAVSYPGAAVGPSAFGLEHPILKVTLVLAPDNTGVEIDMGFGTLKSNKDMAFARVSKPLGPVAQINTYQLAIMNKGVADLRFRKPVDVDVSKVARIKLDGKDGMLILERSYSKNLKDGQTEKKSSEYTWNMVSPLAKPVKTYKVQSLLSALGGLKATRFGPRPSEQSLDSTGLKPPQKTVTLYDEKGTVLGVLKIGICKDKSTWVLGDARDNICMVPSDKLTSVLVAPKDLIEFSP